MSASVFISQLCSADQFPIRFWDQATRQTCLSLFQQLRLSLLFLERKQMYWPSLPHVDPLLKAKTIPVPTIQVTFKVGWFCYCSESASKIPLYMYVDGWTQDDWHEVLPTESINLWEKLHLGSFSPKKNCIYFTISPQPSILVDQNTATFFSELTSAFEVRASPFVVQRKKL